MLATLRYARSDISSRGMWRVTLRTGDTKNNNIECQEELDSKCQVERINLSVFVLLVFCNLNWGSWPLLSPRTPDSYCSAGLLRRINATEGIFSGPKKVDNILDKITERAERGGWLLVSNMSQVWPLSCPSPCWLPVMGKFGIKQKLKEKNSESRYFVVIATGIFTIPDEKLMVTP